MSIFKSNKPHYQYNKRTLKYERVEHTIWYGIKKLFRHIFLGLVFGVAFFIIFSIFIPSPTNQRLTDENEKISSQYEVLSKQLDDAIEILSLIQERDNNFYRVMLETDSIPSSIRTGNYDATARYQKWQKLKTSEIVTECTQKIDQLNRMLYTQSNSYDELVELAKQKEDRLLHTPAIQPILNKDLKRTASGYGRRIDPIYKTIRFHKGLDFSAPIGTEIFAPANGKVQFMGWKQGYGRCMIIDHGYDYTTLYAHLNGFKKGLRKYSKVKRGDVIAYVGNTGKSTGPHLHYEVRVKGRHQNPQNYFFLDLSPEDYDKMIRISANSSQTFD